jgi:hypothetical protein
MTTLEALQQAKRRWGDVGHVHHQPDALEPGRFRVGRKVADVFLVIGVGQSWEEALRAADQNGQNPP